MQKLFFIRHGESEANQKEICAGHTDVSLTALGLHQARDAGKEILESHLDIDLIISSPLKRAFDTAKEIAAIIGYPENRIVIKQEAIERSRGSFEGRPSKLQDGITEEIFISEGAESEEQMKLRAAALFNFLKECPDSNILIVSHNQFGRSFVAYVTNKNRDEVEKIPNAHVISLDQLV